MAAQLWSWALSFAIGLCLPFGVWADTACEVSFLQNGLKVQPELLPEWAVVRLGKAPFQISVSPSECRPLMATLTNEALITEVAKLSELVFVLDGYGFAGGSEDADVLHWPSRTPIRTDLKELSTDWSVIDTYKSESDRLGYRPQPVMAWGAAFPFQPSPKDAVATFRRLTQSIPLGADMPNLRLPAVIYLTVKDLMKPAWQDAVALLHLVKPYKVLLVFN